ncbi:hypothetical protein [Streptomyces sp. NRRL S-87]|uniref:hypothetical protein n=1 Tax=Streptomyces sp. NRRL S-87 TaxID=1463920 RepID=UPI00131CE723|nr:hypothetical protein [Streptomyces sp. NRRL S-87]
MSEDRITATPSWRSKNQAALDWSSLAHAYGSASDLPSLFDRLCDGEASDAGRAMSDIALRVCHQGAAVEEATAPSVVVLMDIAASSDARLAERIIRVLRTISESLGTWARMMGSSSPDHRSAYASKVRWEQDVLRSLGNGSGPLGAAISREASPLIPHFEKLVEAISEAEQRLDRSVDLRP